MNNRINTIYHQIQFLINGIYGMQLQLVPQLDLQNFILNIESNI